MTRSMFYVRFIIWGNVYIKALTLVLLDQFQASFKQVSNTVFMSRDSPSSILSMNCTMIPLDGGGGL